jgi:coenzyme F420 hydrogenase subunit beta
MDQNNPLLPEPFIAKTKEDILNASSSKYCPVPANKAIREIIESEGRFAIVGLPCHLHGMRKAEIANEDLNEKIVLHLGLFCSHTVNFHATHHLLRRIGLNPREVARIDYRGRGWPGGIIVRNKSGHDQFIPNQDSLWSTIFGSFFFTPISCLWCPDPLVTHGYRKS